MDYPDYQKSTVLIDPNITMDDVKNNFIVKKKTEAFYNDIIIKLKNERIDKNKLLNYLEGLRRRDDGYIIPPFLKYYGDDKENVSGIIRSKNHEINVIIEQLPVSKPIEIGGRKRRKRYTKKNMKKNKFINKRNKKSKTRNKKN
jgi:hypothetical protein